MFKLPESVERLVNAFSRLPGIGPRSAQRLAFHLIKNPKSEADELSEAVKTARESVGYCRECSSITDMEVCSICDDSSRDRTLICVVENPQDILAVESSGEYKGLYHVLLGSLSPLNGIGPEDLKINKLIERIKNSSIKEVIIATDPNVEGEATAIYIKDMLDDTPVLVTRIAHGVPIGGNLEYADSVTLGKALEGRREF
ncbi:MAG: recombination mediator RecR [Elusimicrobiota bacterium]